MYLVFDIETIVDEDIVYETSKELIGEVAGTLVYEERGPCVKRVLEDACRKTEAGKTCFVPEKFQSPVVAAMLIIGPRGEYIAHDVMNAKAGTEGLVRKFWHNMQVATAPPTNVQRWVSFNGKKFDGPVMTHWAFRLGIPIPKWLPGFEAKPWEDPRNEILSSPHLDLLHQVAGTKYVAGGAGSLDYWSRTLGLPGKPGVHGNQVPELWTQGKVAEIEDYCLTDCLNTAGLLLGILRAQGAPVAPRSKEFEATMIKVCDARPGSKILETYWKAFGPSLPF